VIWLMSVDSFRCVFFMYCWGVLIIHYKVAVIKTVSSLYRPDRSVLSYCVQTTASSVWVTSFGDRGYGGLHPLLCVRAVIGGLTL
jgi:hypothetical protein